MLNAKDAAKLSAKVDIRGNQLLPFMRKLDKQVRASASKGFRMVNGVNINEVQSYRQRLKKQLETLGYKVKLTESDSAWYVSLEW
jgi:hypothetical protein